MAMTGQHRTQIEPPRREKGERRGRMTPRGRQVAAVALDEVWPCSATARAGATC